jgi:hypothetical protein
VSCCLIRRTAAVLILVTLASPALPADAAPDPSSCTPGYACAYQSGQSSAQEVLNPTLDATLVTRRYCPSATSLMGGAESFGALINHSARNASLYASMDCSGNPVTTVQSGGTYQGSFGSFLVS